MNKFFSRFSFAILAAAAWNVPAEAQHTDRPTHILEVKAADRDARTRIANLGYAPEDIRSDKVFVWAQAADAVKIRDAGFEVKSIPLSKRLFSLRDSTRYHSYDQLNAELAALQSANPAIVTVGSLGRSTENRDIPLVRISGKNLGQAENEKLPVAFYMGCHHAREHLSVEVPLMFAQYLVREYEKNPDVKRLVDSREIYIAPMINPDGHVYDFDGNSGGEMWRKNRSRNADGSKGVDLNRNYGYGWGTGGSSNDPSSDVYMGTAPFSEPETRAVRDFTDSQPRMKIMLSTHTFSELVLYPWGHLDTQVGEKEGFKEDLPIFKKMAKDMSAWNQYTPEQSSDLYIASGDTTDWAYGTHRIFGFTFELTPTSMWGGGFYPGDQAIDPTFAANLKPMLYMLEYANNPARVLTEQRPSFLETPSRMGVPVADPRDATAL